MISTFYSYKGGVGRSMALANVADVFAHRGLRTAVVDFDLEAPGIERFFRSDPAPVRRSRGLLDLLLAYKEAMSMAPGTGEAEFRNLENFLVPIYHQLPSGGTLDLLSAGQRGDDEQLATYAYNLRTFDWQEFYFEWLGEMFFQWLRRELLNRYDVVLVDSRTGMTEMGGVCAYQLADHLVMFCAANSQNVQGTRDIIRNFQSPRVMALRKGRPLDVVVVPARVQQNSREVERSHAEFERSFRQFTPQPLLEAGQTMWDLMLPYEAAYAFEEHLLTSDGNESALRDAYERLADTVALLAPPNSRLHTTKGGGQREPEPPAPVFDPTRPFAGFDVFLSYNREDQAAAEWIALALEERGLNVWLDVWRLAPGDPLEATLERALDQSRAFILLIGPSEAGVWVKFEQQLILERSLRARDDFRLIPVLLPGASVESIPAFLRDYTSVDFRSSLDDEWAMNALVAGVRGRAPGPRHAPSEELRPYRTLEPYREADAALFFGREREVAEAVRLVVERNFVVIVGPSGSGKTSLVYAGVIPQLRAIIPGIRILPMRSGSDPFRSLATALETLLPVDADVLRQNPATLAALLRALSHPVLLVIDQLEEIWVTVDAGLRSAFLASIREAIGACRMILVLRADFYSTALDSGLTGLFSIGQVNIGPISEKDLREAIEAPVRLAGLAFEPGLVDRIVEDARGSAAPLPLLQVVLNQLWSQRKQGFLTHDSYQQMGGVSAVLSLSADRAFASLTPEEQRSAKALLLRMVRPDGTRNLLEISQLHPRELKVLDALVNASVVVIDREGQTPVATLGHEGFIHAWPRLVAWIDEIGEILRIRIRVEQDAADWAKNERAPEFLYRGRVLERAEDLVRRHPELVSPLQLEFLDASRSARKPVALLERVRQWLRSNS